MPYLRDRVFILKSEPFREHDRRIVCFGKQHGLIEAVARGASANLAKQGGHLVPLSEAEVMVARGKAFDKLAVAHLIHAHREARKRLGALAFIGAFFDLFISLQRPGIVDAECYGLLEELMSAAETLPDEPSRERAQLIFSAAALKLLDQTGFAPQLSRCALCRDELRDGEFRQLSRDGSIVHADCYRDIRAQEPNAAFVPFESLAVARFLRRSPIKDALLLSGAPSAFSEAASAIFATVRHTPLFREPHGMRTVGELMRD
jgi:DNA repair protein RecO